MKKNTIIGLAAALIVASGITAFVWIRRYNSAALKIIRLTKYPNLPALKASGFFPEEVIQKCSYAEPKLKSTNLRHANFLSMFVLPIYHVLRHEADPLHKLFLDNQYADDDPTSYWLGLDASQLKEASRNAISIIMEKKTPVLKRLTTQKVADLTVSFFYAALKRMSKEYRPAVASKEMRDKKDLFSWFEQTINTDDIDNFIRSMHIVRYPMAFGFNVTALFYYLCGPSQMSDLRKKYTEYNHQTETDYYSGFALKGDIRLGMRIFQDLVCMKTYSIVD